MRLSSGLNVICLCIVLPLTAQPSVSSAPGNRAVVERVETNQVRPREVEGRPILVLDQGSGVLECGAFKLAERPSLHSKANSNSLDRRSARRSDTRQRARMPVNVCTLPRFSD